MFFEFAPFGFEVYLINIEWIHVLYDEESQ